VAAALTSVPAPQIREAANDAAADAALAMTSVCNEMRRPERRPSRSALASGDSTHFSLSRHALNDPSK
jgi:hypothetical protein